MNQMSCYSQYLAALRGSLMMMISVMMSRRHKERSWMVAYRLPLPPSFHPQTNATFHTPTDTTHYTQTNTVIQIQTKTNN
jgi:hypothetical protein